MLADARGKFHRVPAWMIMGCRRIGTWRGFVWTNLIGLGINLLATWLVSARDTPYAQDPITDLVKHWFLYAPLLLTLEGLFGLIAIIGRLPMLKKPPHKVRREYLASVIEEMEKLRIEGIPMIYSRVDLDEVFIWTLSRTWQVPDIG